jgi:hypothetical protein
VGKSRTVTLKVLGNTRSGERAVESLSVKCETAADRIGGAFSKVGKISALSGLAAQGLQLTGALLPAAGAVLALPSAMGVAAIATNTLKLGMTGLGDAMKALGEGDTEKLNEALDKMSPKARTFTRELVALKTSGFDPLKNTVQDALFDRLDQSVARLARAELPVLKRGLGELASEMNAAGRTAAATASTPWFRGQVGQALDGTAKTMHILRGAVSPLMRAVISLVNTGMPLVQQFSRWAVGGIKAGAAFLTSERGAAKLDSIVHNAIGTLSTLGSIAANLGSGVGHLFGPAVKDSGELLVTIDQLTAKFAAWSGSAAGQAEIGKTFALLRQVGSDLVSILPMIAGPLGTIAHTVNSLPPGVQGVVAQMLAWSGVAGLLIPKLTGVVSVAGKIGGAGVAGIKGIASAASGAAGVLGRVAGGFRDAQAAQSAFSGAAGTFGGALRTGVDAVADLGSKAASTAGNVAKLGVEMAASAGKAALATAATAGRVVAGWVLMGGQALMQAARVALAWMIAMGPVGIIIAAVVAVVALIVANWDKIKNAIGVAWEWVKDKTGAVWEWIKNAIGVAINFITKYFLPFAIVRLIAENWDKIKAGAKAAWDWIVDKIKDAVQLTLSAVAWLGQLPGKVAEWFGGVKDRAVAQALGLVNWLKGLPGRILTSLGNLASLLLSAGRNLIEGLINGVKAMAGKVIEAAKGVVQSAIDGAKRLLGISSPSRVFDRIGRDTVAGLIKGLTSDQSGVEAASKKLATTIKRMFDGPLEDRLVAAVGTANSKLKSLAEERQKIAETIKAAADYAMNTAANARSRGALSTMQWAENEKPTAYGIKSRLIGALMDVRAWSSIIKKLATRGLHPSILQQVIDMGPADGRVYGQALLDADVGTFKSINTTQSAIDKAAKVVGKTAADIMFDSGKQAGKGFLTGLQAQQKEIEKAMQQIADALVKRIKTALKIKSPSRVMHGLGAFTGQGFAQGLMAQAGLVSSAADSLAGAAVAPARSAGAYGTGGAAAATVVHNHFDLTVVASPASDQAAIGRASVEAVAEFVRRGGRISWLPTG